MTSSWKCFYLVFLLLSATLQDSSKKGPKCKKPSGSVGSTYYRGCTVYTCIQASKKLAIWSEGPALDICCVQDGELYLTGRLIQNNTVGPCHQVSLTCEDVDGTPSITTTVGNTCPPPYEVIEDKLEYLEMKVDDILGHVESCGGGGGGSGGSGGGGEGEDCICGEVLHRSRIVGGAETEINEYPWQAAIVDNGGSWPWCGGSLVNSKWVMSAAHCFQRTNPSQIQVVLGDHQYTIDTETEHYRADVARIYNHPQYNGDTFNNDFSLLELVSEVPWSQYPHIRPICLPEDDHHDYAGQLATVTGWGTLSSGGYQPEVLHGVEVDIITNYACKYDYDYNPSSITETMLCANVVGGGKDACQGDSGGPLITGDPHHDHQVLAGVVSWGYGCAYAEYPGVYARVTSVLPWIKSTITSGDFCPAGHQDSDYYGR